MNAPGHKSIAIIRLSSLGDIVHTIPAFNLLRKQFPQARISWFAEPAGAALLKNVTGIDEIIPLNLKVKGFFKKIHEVLSIRSLYRNRFDIILDFQGLLKSAVLARILNGTIIGFGKNNLKEPQARFFYRHQVSSFNEDSHVIYKNFHLVRDLITPDNPLLIEYPMQPIPPSENLQRFLSENGLVKSRCIILNVGGAWESKILAIHQYIEIVQRLREKCSYPVVILWGNAKEEAIAREVSRKTQALMTAFFDFSELILFIQHARLVVSADTLALHLADMVKTPSVGFFGPTSPWRNGSLLPGSIAVFGNLNCSFCYKKKCSKADCIKKINIDQIIEAVGKINEECD